MDAPIIHIQETESTNKYLKETPSKNDLPDGTIVYTDFQTAGRGQRGNSWESERGKNLSFSIIVHPKHIEVTRNFLISQIISLAVEEVLSTYTQDISIKWPNDIYHNDNKLAGILIENELVDGIITNSIIGVGININQTIFTSDAPNPISLTQITKKNYDLLTLLAEIQTKFLYLYNKSQRRSFFSITKNYMERLYRREGAHSFSTPEGEVFRASIRGVDFDGSLILALTNGETRRYYFKEVSYIL